MDRTVRELRNRIANLETQRDALASALCEKAEEVDAWKYRYIGSIEDAVTARMDRDAAIRRVGVDGRWWGGLFEGQG